MADNSDMSSAFNISVFQRLVGDVGSIPVVYDFASSFLALLPERIQCIDQALRDKDQEKTLSSLLRLRASAAMLGAKQLETSMDRVLAGDSVECTPPGPLKRTLEAHAEAFRRAFAQAHSM